MCAKTSKTIALAQFRAGDNREENVKKGEAFIKEAKNKGADLIVFPEMSFDIFFPQYRAEKRFFDLAEPIPGPMVEKFCQIAKDNSIAIVFNMFESGEVGEYYDCSPVIDKFGNYLGKSRMMHIAELPDYNEKFYYWEGDTDYPVFDLGGLKVGIAICYDRHYPEQIRLLALKGAQVIVVPTATSLGELKHVWHVEMQAAAIANQVYIAIANRVGKEVNLNFFGNSFAANPFGEIITVASEEKEELLIFDLEPRIIKEARHLFPFLRDRRADTYKDITKKTLW